MTTYDAILQDVIEYDEDDAPRLILADWLEDQGEPRRAEFIRLGVEAAHRGFGCCIQDKPYLRCHRKSCPLCRTEKLMCDGFHTCPSDPSFGNFALLIMGWEKRREAGLAGEIGCKNAMFFHRGFPAAVMAEQGHFVRHAKSLFRHCPITEVRLTGKHTDQNRLKNQWRWWRQREEHLTIPPYIHHDIWDCIDGRVDNSLEWPMKTFGGEVAAEQALSDACVRYGLAKAWPRPQGVGTSGGKS